MLIAQFSANYKTCWISFESCVRTSVPIFFVCFSFFFFFFLKTAYILRLHHRFPGKWLLRKRRWNCILIMRHYPDFGSASDWSCGMENFLQPIRSTTQIWIKTRHQYGIPAFVSQWWLFSQACFSCCLYHSLFLKNVLVLTYSKHF